MSELLLAIGIGGLVFVILITIIILIIYSGLFQTIEVGAGPPPIGNAIIAYKFQQGPYKEAGDLYTEVAKFAPDQKSLGIYYDDPNVVPSHKLRYIVGAILGETEDVIDQSLKSKLVNEGFSIMTLPAVTNVVKTTFPYKSTMSIIIAIYRVYPKLSSYIQENRLCAHPMMEIYLPNEIQFMVPLAHQDEFYAPEALAASDTPSNDESLADTSMASSDLPMDDSHVFDDSSVHDDTNVHDDSSVSTEAAVDSSVSDLKSESPESDSHPEVEATIAASAIMQENEAKAKEVETASGNSASVLQDSGVSSISPGIELVSSIDPDDKTEDTGSDKSTASSFEEITMDVGDIEQ